MELESENLKKGLSSEDKGQGRFRATGKMTGHLKNMPVVVSAELETPDSGSFIVQLFNGDASKPPIPFPNVTSLIEDMDVSLLAA
jgi:hypothetical protein